MSLTLVQPKSLGTTASKIFFGVGLALPAATAALSLLYIPLGLMTTSEVYPWDQVLSILFFLAIIVTPESICVYFFQNKIIKRFLARMAYVIMVVFLYANYIFLPPGVYTVLPVAVATLIWAVWPSLATIALGFAVGKIEARRTFS